MIPQWLLTLAGTLLLALGIANAWVDQDNSRSRGYRRRIWPFVVMVVGVVGVVGVFAG